MERNKRQPQLCDKLQCTGCAACASVCPKDAITMKAGIDGFLHPSIDEELCIGCLTCEKSCPVLNPVTMHGNSERPEVYACWNLDSVVRAESSSGGAFSALAAAVIDEGGYVYGAAYDENMVVRHRECHTHEEIELLRGSKYVQSEIGDTFRAVRRRLTEGAKVLFVGTPCQVSGLRAYLRRDYDNLYCCDFICHGTPSPLLFSKYLQWVEQRKGIKITKFNFRHKRAGWNDSTRAVNGNLWIKGKNDAFCIAFYRDLSLRESCYNCPSIGLPRKGDITVGDFHGIGMMYKFDSPKEIPGGVSLVMVNNERGAELLDVAKKRLNWRKGHFDEALRINGAMVMPARRPIGRDRFYKDMSRLEFELLRQKYLRQSGKERAIAFLQENAPRILLTNLRSLVRYLTWKRNGSKRV